MRRRLSTCIIVVGLFPCTGFGQTADAQNKFEIVDVHVSSRTLHPVKKGGGFRDGRYELEMATMVDLIAAAYGIAPNKVWGGPSWLDMDRFDVIAKAPLNTSPAALKLMLQALLAERFHLAVHPDQKSMLSFSQNGAPVQQAAPGAGPADPNGALSLSEAINRQLGLKLELEKRPAPVLVIDHVEQKPVDN